MKTASPAQKPGVKVQHPWVSVRNPRPGLKKRPRAQWKPDGGGGEGEGGGWRDMTEMEKLWKPDLGWPVRGH